ncbi:MAG: hypothetical protein ACLUQC_11085 [Lactococcus raffinolactis]
MAAVDSDWYWLDADSGVMKTGWVLLAVHGVLNADGKITGWKCLNGTWYYRPVQWKHACWLA